MKTFWITKYALTTGITRADGCDAKDGYASRSTFTQEDYIFARIGKDAFETEAEAKLNAIKKANAKLKSVEKARKKLLALIADWA